MENKIALLMTKQNISAAQIHASITERGKSFIIFILKIIGDIFIKTKRNYSMTPMMFAGLILVLTINYFKGMWYIDVSQIRSFYLFFPCA